MGQGRGEEGKEEVKRATFPTLLTMIVDKLILCPLKLCITKDLRLLLKKERKNDKIAQKVIKEIMFISMFWVTFVMILLHIQ